MIVVPLIGIAPTAPSKIPELVMLIVPLPVRLPPLYVKVPLVSAIVPALLNVPPLTCTLAWKPEMFAPVSVPIVPPLPTVNVLLLVAVLELSSVSLPPLAIWMGMELAPPLIWYSFHNWDLLVVCATTSAFYYW